MGLSKDIEDALVKSLGPDAVGKGNMPELSKDISDAIVKFITKQTFRITEMKAILEVEEIKTGGPLQADVLSSVSVTTTVAPGIIVATSGGPGSTTSPGTGTGAVTQGKKGVLIPKINYKKRGGQGGAMSSKGHAYIGNNPVSRSESNVNKTKVKLLTEDIVEK